MRDPIDSFGIHWEGAIYDSGFVSAKLQRDGLKLPAGFLKALFEWVEGRNDHTGARFKALYESDLDIFGEWIFDRPLGRGAFGVVALYRRYLGDSVLDEIVIKDAAKRPGDEVNKTRNLLSREAVVLAQTNDLNTESLLRLRNYKYFHMDDQYRYFFRNCEHGDLELLRLKYKAWQIIPPEPFLWHLLKWFTDAHTNMTEGPFRSLRSKDFGKELNGGYLIHSDIKTDNVLLQAVDEQHAASDDYPTITIGDFGASGTTTLRDRATNRASEFWRGTQMWMPPELRTEQNMCNRLFAEPQDARADPAAHIITTQTNLWAMAAVMWTFMTGREIEDLDIFLRNLLRNRHPPHEDFVDPMEPDRRRGQDPLNEYSKELRYLVRDCLKLIPKNRPSLHELRMRVDHGIQACETHEADYNRRYPHQPTSRRRVYFHANEINNAPRGGANYNLDAAFWKRFVAATLFVPEEWGMLLPPTAPDDLKPNTKWSSELQKRWLQNMKQARAGKRHRDGDEDRAEPIKKRTTVRRAFTDLRNAVPFKTHRARPFAPRRGNGAAPSAQLVSTPHDSSSDDDERRRPVLGGFVEPKGPPFRGDSLRFADSSQAHRLTNFQQQPPQQAMRSQRANTYSPHQSRQPAPPNASVRPTEQTQAAVGRSAPPASWKAEWASQASSGSAQLSPMFRSPTSPPSSTTFGGPAQARPRATTERKLRRPSRAREGWITAEQHAAARAKRDRDATKAALEGKKWSDGDLIEL